MKTKMSKYIFRFRFLAFFLISACVFAFASCSNLNTNDDDENLSANSSSQKETGDFGEGYGAVRISIADSARTAYPLLSDYTNWDWTLQYKGSGTDFAGSGVTVSDWADLNHWDEKNVEIENSTFKEKIPVLNGNWSLRLVAKKIVSVSTGEDSMADKTIMTYTSAEKSVTIEKNTVSNVSFTLSLTGIDTATDGTGKFAITVKYTSAAVKRVTGTLLNAPDFSDTFEPTAIVDSQSAAIEAYTEKDISPADGKYVYSLEDVPCGNYIAAFNFYDASGNKLNASGVEEYVYIVKGELSESTLEVASLDDVYTITYIPSPNATVQRSFTRHAAVTLPTATNSDGNLLDSGTSLFCGWYETSDYSGTPCTEIEAGTRGNKTFYGKYIAASESVAVPDSLTLKYLDNGITDTELEGLAQVGNTISLTESISPTCSYQWFTVDSVSDAATAISDASGTSYKLTNGEVGKKIMLGITKKYTIGNEAGTGSTILYHTVADNTEETAHVMLMKSDAEAVVEQGTLSLTGITIQYSGKVIVGNKPDRSSLVLSGILKDIYGNTISNSLLNGDFADYTPLTSSKNLGIAFTVEGYSLTNSASDPTVFVTVQNAKPTGVALSTDVANISARKIAFTPETIALEHLVYSTDGKTWNAIPSGEFEKTSSSFSVRYEDIGTAGSVGYIAASPAVSVAVTSANVGTKTEGGSGDEPVVVAEDKVVLLSGTEINKLFLSKFKTARKFVYASDDSTASSPVTISDASSTIEVKAWKTGSGTSTTINVYASGYIGAIPLNKDSSKMFAGLTNLKSVDLSNFSTKEVKNGDKVKYEAVTDMSSMFSGCTALTEVIFGDDFDTSAVTDMSGMFSGTGNLASLDLSKFKTGAVTNMSGMFNGCGVTELDLSKFDTGAVTNMMNMFADCINLETLTLGTSFTTVNVTDMSGMFQNLATVMELDLSSFNTENVTTMEYMFSGMESLESLDLTGFDTSNVTKMASMFDSCASLSKIYVDSTKWNTAKVVGAEGDGGEDMFSGCESIIGGNGTQYDEFNTDATYAVIDTSATPGYLTSGN